MPPLPAIATSITGRVYRLDANPLGLLSMILTFPTNDEARPRTTATGYWTYDDDSEWAAGLDGMERFALGRMDILAAGTDEWLDATTFRVDVDELGNLELHRLTLVFVDGGRAFPLPSRTRIPSTPTRHWC